MQALLIMGREKLFIGHPQTSMRLKEFTSWNNKKCGTSPQTGKTVKQNREPGHRSIYLNELGIRKRWHY